MKIAEIVQMMVEDTPPMRFEAFDGSSFGPVDAQYTLRLKNERGLRYVATAPGDLGLGRAYVAGDLDVLDHPLDVGPATEPLDPRVGAEAVLQPDEPVVDVAAPPAARP